MQTRAIAIAATGTALALAPPALAGTTLRLHDHTTRVKQVSDGLVIHQRVTDRATGKRVGHVRVRIYFISKHKVHAKVRLKLADGTLRASFDSDPDDRVTHGTIDGGTGAYEGATGTLKDVAVGGENTNDDNLTITLD